MFEKMKNYLVTNKRRIGMSLFGVIVCAISVGIFKIAALVVEAATEYGGAHYAALPGAFLGLFMV